MSSIIRSTGKLFSANVFRSGISFLGIIFFARAIGSDSLGVYFLFQAVLGICGIVADFGVKNALTKRISEGSQQESYLSAAILIKLGTVSVVGCVIVVSQSYINWYLGEQIARYLILGLCLQQFSQLMIGTLHGELRVGKTATIELLEQVLWIVTSVVLFYFNYGLMALIYGFLLGKLVKLLFAWARKKTSVGWPERVHFQSLFDYSKFSVISSIGGFAYSWLDILIIGFFLTASHVSAYEVAWRVTTFVLLFSKALGLTVFPQISEWSSEDAVGKIESLIPTATFASLIVSIPAFFGTVLFSAEIIEYLFGAEYLLASTAIVILMLEKIFQSVHKVWGYSLQALDRPDQAAIATVVSLLVNVGLNVVLIPAFGLAGAASATAISFALNTLLHAHFLSKSVTLSLSYDRTLWCILASVGMTTVLYGVRTLVPVTSIAVLFGLIIMGVLVYFSIILSYGPIRDDTRILMQGLIR